MNRNTATQKVKWKSKGATISKSRYHQDLYIVDHGDGRFHSVSSTHEIISKKYPEDKPKEKKRVLVIGNSGSIQFGLAKALAEKAAAKVILTNPIK